MKTVSKNSGARKKAARDRRILAKARREDGEGRRTPRNPGAVRPSISAEIQRAASRAGIKPKSSPMLLTGRAFAGATRIDPEATVADLLRLMFEAPNRPRGTGNADPDTFVEDVLLCSADEAEIISLAVASDSGISDELQRIMLRANYRAIVALELAQRMRDAAAVVSL